MSSVKEKKVAKVATDTKKSSTGVKKDIKKKEVPKNKIKESKSSSKKNVSDEEEDACVLNEFDSILPKSIDSVDPLTPVIEYLSKKYIEKINALIDENKKDKELAIKLRSLKKENSRIVSYLEKESVNYIKLYEKYKEPKLREYIQINPQTGFVKNIKNIMASLQSKLKEDESAKWYKFFSNINEKTTYKKEDVKKLIRELLEANGNCQPKPGKSSNQVRKMYMLSDNSKKADDPFNKFVCLLPKEIPGSKNNWTKDALDRKLRFLINLENISKHHFIPIDIKINCELNLKDNEKLIAYIHRIRSTEEKWLEKYVKKSSKLTKNVKKEEEEEESTREEEDNEEEEEDDD